MDIELDLKSIFSNVLKVAPERVGNLEMKTTESWDSFSHISLMMEIEQNMLHGDIDAETIPELTSFEKCFIYIKKCREAEHVRKG